MDIATATRLNPIVSFSAENFISNEAMLNMKTTCGMYVNLDNWYYLTNETINTDEISNIFNVENFAFSTDGLSRKLKELSELSINYPIEYLSQYLTDVTNTYLSQIFNLKIDIDDIFLDFDELIDYLSVSDKYKACIDKLVYKIMKTLELNHSKIDIITNAINDNKSILRNENFYIIPILYCEGIVYLKPTLNKAHDTLKLINAFKQITTRKYEVPENSVIHDFLLELENISEIFKNTGFIKCCFKCVNNMKSYESFIIYKNIDDKFIVQV